MVNADQGCAVNGCPRSQWCKDWCRKHYKRWVDTGFPMGSKRTTIEQLILGSVVSENGCWLWQGVVEPSGYGRHNKVMAHRLSYEVFIGGVPPDKQLDHLCRVRHCVRPSHLEAVTLRENVLRGVGFSAINARKTHCPQGHPYSEANTYSGKSYGGRVCRICASDRQRRYKARKRLRRKGVPTE